MTLRVKQIGKQREPTIAAGFGAALIEFAVSRGATEAELLALAGVRASDLVNADARIPIVQYVALLKAGAEVCRDPAFALRFGSEVSLEDVSIVGLIGLASATMGEGREQLNRFARLIIDAEGSPPEMMELRRASEGVWLELTAPIFFRHPMLVEAAFARFVCGVARTGRRFPRAIHFAHAPPSYREEYERIFNVPITFSSNRNGLLTDDEFLAIKLPPQNRYVFGLLCERAAALLAELKASDSVRARVEAILIPLLHTGDIEMANVAEKLGTSVSTLYRQLASEGARYELVVDELRRTMAMHFLDAKKASINETAFLVGFSEASAFSRAFKRWTGKSPSEYQRSR